MLELQHTEKYTCFARGNIKQFVHEHNTNIDQLDFY